jgi:hypothetical protein
MASPPDAAPSLVSETIEKRAAMWPRQVATETRKLFHPAVALSILAAAAVAAYLQVTNLSTPYPPPSGADLSGSTWIAAEQLSSTLGFFVVAVCAAVGTASELETGVLEVALLYEPRRSRQVVARIAAMVVALTVALVCMALVVWLSVAVAEYRGSQASGDGAAWSTALLTVARFSVVALSASALATLVALLIPSEVASTITTVSVFVVPGLLQRLPSLRPLILAWWIERWMNYDSLGRGVDYLAGDSTLDHVSHPAGVVIAALGVGFGAAATWVLRSRGELRPAG